MVSSRVPKSVCGRSSNMTVFSLCALVAALAADGHGARWLRVSRELVQPVAVDSSAPLTVTSSARAQLPELHSRFPLSQRSAGLMGDDMHVDVQLGLDQAHCVAASVAHLSLIHI